MTEAAKGALTAARAVQVFLVFAFAYFLSALVRAITATLAPTLTAEFDLKAADLGLLAGGYFLGFAVMQIPLGKWLDRWGPKRVVVVFLCVAVMACVAFSLARGFASLLAARVLCGMGVSACLMAPLTGFRVWLAPVVQTRANSWMLMVGSLGMVASTLPVQWLMPHIGWRGIFLVLACGMVSAIFLIQWAVPRWTLNAPDSAATKVHTGSKGYGEVWKNPYFRSLAPIGFFNFGGMVAIQTLWASPWMIKVGGYSAMQAATGLFWLHVAMLLSFLCWGLANPWLERKGYTANRLMVMGLPFSMLLVAIIIIAGDAYSAWTSGLLIAYCVCSTVVALAQPAVGMAFRPELAGRALSAYNLVIFSGIFTVQWGIGLLVDAFLALNMTEPQAYQAAFGVFGLCCVASYVYYLRAKTP